MTIVVLQAPFGFGAELVATGGRVVASASSPIPVAKERSNVLLLIDVVGSDTGWRSLPQLVAPGLASPEESATSGRFRRKRCRRVC